MDIKLKSIKYSKATKAVAVGLVWLCFMTAALGGGFVLFNQEVLENSGYFETREFNWKFSNLVHDAVELNVVLQSEEKIKGSGEAADVIAEKLSNFYTIRDRLAQTVNFAYYIKDSNSGNTLAFMDAKERIAALEKQYSYTFVKYGSLSERPVWNEDLIRRMLEGTPYEIHAAVLEPLKQGDEFYKGYMHFYKVKEALPFAIGLSVASVMVMISGFIYLVLVAGRKEKDGEIELSPIDKIYTDVHSILVFVAAILSIGLVNEAAQDSNTLMVFIAAAIIFGIDAWIGLSYILSMVRQIKNRQILRNTLIFQSYKKVRGIAALALGGSLFKPWILLLLVGYGLINGVLTHLFLEALKWAHYWDAAFGLLIIAFNIAVVYFAAKSLTNLTQIMEAVKEISVGNVDHEIDRNEISIAFAGLADNLQNLQKGLKKAVSEAIKGERMKTELITNVSHDLKTPLTSIINYVDLLKQEDLSNENAIAYIGILEEKSGRLRQLVEDLIEASKASSGNLSVNAEKVDLHQLIMQAYGEYEEKLEKASLDMRINAAKGEVLVNADGRHLWRILENLLTNALKYSMPSSRIYVNIDKNEQYGVLTIKNISEFPLEISPEQLSERFVRGDASRTTDGSGLGLSIAQGLTQLQGGRFKVEIDGDLFKVMVEIPLWEEILAI